MPLELKRPEVSVKYEATVDHDPTVYCKGYSGKLSNVNLVGADHLCKSKAYLKLKPKPESPDGAAGDKE